MLSISSTISLEPEPIPIEIKVVLTGDRWLYYLLKKYDPEFNQLFKVAADFSEDIDRNTENTVLYSQMIAQLLREKEFKPFDPNAVALVIESSARAAEDAEKLSLHKGDLIDLLREADYWSAESGHHGQQRRCSTCSILASAVLTNCVSAFTNRCCAAITCWKQMAEQLHRSMVYPSFS